MKSLRNIYNRFICTKILLILLILFLAGFTGCGKGEGNDADVEQEIIDETPDLFKEINQIGKMNFASMTVTKTVTTERSKWYKIGKRIGVYSYDVYLKSFIDLEKLTPENITIDKEAKKVILILPEVQVEVDGRSPELRKEYEHIDLFRTTPDSKERAELKEIANNDFQKEFRSNPAYVSQLKQLARRKAKSYFISLIESNGYEADVRFPGEKDSPKIQIIESENQIGL